MVKYYRLPYAPNDFQPDMDSWSETQPILMIIKSYMKNTANAMEVRGNHDNLLDSHVLNRFSVVPRDSKYYDNPPSKRQFHQMCCDVEIKNEVGSAFPYANVIYTPDIFFENFLDCSDRKRFLEDIFLANEKYHKLDTICFFNDFWINNSDQTRQKISLELKSFFDGKKSKVLKRVLCDSFLDD